MKSRDFSFVQSYTIVSNEPRYRADGKLNHILVVPVQFDARLLGFLPLEGY